jgi:hypothetical protein
MPFRRVSALLHLDDEVSLKVSRNYRSAVQDLMG